MRLWCSVFLVQASPKVPMVPVRASWWAPESHSFTHSQSRRNFRSFLRTSIDRIIDIDRIGVEKSMLHRKGEGRCEAAKHCSVLENRDVSNSSCRHRAKSKHFDFSIVLEDLARVRQLFANGWAGWAGCFTVIFIFILESTTFQIHWCSKNWNNQNCKAAVPAYHIGIVKTSAPRDELGRSRGREAAGHPETSPGVRPGVIILDRFDFDIGDEFQLLLHLAPQAFPIAGRRKSIV